MTLIKTDTKNKYIEFLKNKFGVEVFNEMIHDENKLCLKEEISYRTIDTKETINKYSKEICDLLSKGDYSSKDWAFDFPGWIGSLDFNLENVREIMVVGMEPHIDDRSYQTTYGLRKTTNGFEEIKDGNNKNMWKTLYAVFNEQKLANDDECYKEEFLSKIYITDLSHFALKGAANQMKKYPDWIKIRKAVATEFLTKEIEFIKPKFIVSQGNEVARSLENSIFNKDRDWERLDIFDDFKEKQSWYKSTPVLQKFKKGDLEVIHVKLPHLASGYTQRVWKLLDGNENENFRKELNNKIYNF